VTENNEPVAGHEPEATSRVEPTHVLSMRQRVTLAALGGVYLSLTVAWLFATQANQFQIDDRFQETMMSFGAFFAIVAAPLYYFTSLVLIRNWLGRLTTLLIGLVILFPFPLFWGVVPR
jgi:hypothetical protein